MQFGLLVCLNNHMSKFSKEELEKFKKDLDQINLDSQSELEDSYYGKEIERVQAELKALKNAKNDHNILDELKKNMEKEDQMITEYEQEISELQRITKNQEKNVIDDTIINQIKMKVAQNSNNSFLQLADDQYNQSLLKQSLLQSKQPQKSTLNNKNFAKKATFAEQIQKEESAIMKKIENANIQRQHLAMQQEDKFSMKYQMECLSQLFSQRFLRPKLKRLQQKDNKIQLISTKLRSTFTNLTPQIVNQANVLPKNSPQIALKQLKQSKRKALRAISQTNVKVVSKKVNLGNDSFEEVQTKVDQQKEKKVQKLQSQFLQYIVFLGKFLAPLEEISKNYNPKFLKFLDDKEKNVNYDYNQEDKPNQKEKFLSQIASLENAKQLKELKLTFQSITNLKGIEAFLNIRDAQLQFNALNVISPISNCKQLIQLNLSHNKIKDISSVSQFPWLRFLNIDHNMVRELTLKCASLEIVWGGHNVIEDLDVNTCKYLRVLLLNNNKLNQLPKIKLYNLQELNLSKNQLKNLRNLQELILLKKLNFAGNRLQKIDEKLIYLYLNQLNLSNNYITQLNLLFLPCLEHFYLNNNRIATRSQYQAYLPNLKQLNLDENRLEGFSAIWQLLQYSKKMQYLRYSNNQYFLNLREKAREIYEYIIYKYMRNIKIINQSQMDIGIKKYYQSNYDIYYHHINFFNTNHNIIKYLENNINFILHEFTFAGVLQNKKSHFIKEKEYIHYQSVQKIKQLKSTINLIQQYQQYQNTIYSITSSLFYHHDQFQIHRRQLYHHIRTLVINYKYKKEKRVKYYQKIRPKVQMQVVLFTKLIITSQLTKVITKFKNQLKGLSEEKAAIKIQKVWRGYIRRKLYKKLLKNKMKQIDNDSDFEDVDTDFFNQELQRHEFNIENIEGINFQDVIIRPEVFEYLQNKHKKEQDQARLKTNKHKQKEEKILVNNFLDSQTKLKTKKEGKPTQEEQLIKQWGIKDEKLLKTLQYKQQKRMDARKKQEDKSLTAAQRYERFKRGGH